MGLLKQWTTILKDYHLGKYLEDSGLYLIGYLLHDWLSERLLTIFALKFQWLILQVVALLLILGQSEAIRVEHYRMPFGNKIRPWQQIFFVFVTLSSIILLIISFSNHPQTSFLPPACYVIILLLISQWSCENRLIKLTFFKNCDSLHARVNNHYEAWSYKKKTLNKITAYRKSV